MKRRVLPLLVGGALGLAAGGAFAQQPMEQFVPAMGYWVGPYAAGGSGFFGGMIDYMQLVNLRDGASAA